MNCEMMSIISSIYDFPLITGESHMLLSPVYYKGKVIYDGYMTSFSMTYIFTCRKICTPQNFTYERTDHAR